MGEEFKSSKLRGQEGVKNQEQEQDDAMEASESWRQQWGATDLKWKGYSRCEGVLKIWESREGKSTQGWKFGVLVNWMGNNLTQCVREAMVERVRRDEGREKPELTSGLMTLADNMWNHPQKKDGDWALKGLVEWWIPEAKGGSPHEIGRQWWNIMSLMESERSDWRGFKASDQGWDDNWLRIAKSFEGSENEFEIWRGILWEWGVRVREWRKVKRKETREAVQWIRSSMIMEYVIQKMLSQDCVNMVGKDEKVKNEGEGKFSRKQAIRHEANERRKQIWTEWQPYLKALHEEWRQWREDHGKRWLKTEVMQARQEHLGEALKRGDLEAIKKLKRRCGLMKSEINAQIWNEKSRSFSGGLWDWVMIRGVYSPSPMVHWLIEQGMNPWSFEIRENERNRQERLNNILKIGMSVENDTGWMEMAQAWIKEGVRHNGPEWRQEVRRALACRVEKEGEIKNRVEALKCGLEKEELKAIVVQERDFVRSEKWGVKRL